MKRFFSSLLVSLFCFSLVLVPASAADTAGDPISQAYEGFIWIKYAKTTSDSIIYGMGGDSSDPAYYEGNGLAKYPRSEMNWGSVMYGEGLYGSSSDSHFVSPQFLAIPNSPLYGSFGVVFSILGMVGSTDQNAWYTKYDFGSSAIDFFQCRYVTGSNLSYNPQPTVVSEVVRGSYRNLYIDIPYTKQTNVTVSPSSISSYVMSFNSGTNPINQLLFVFNSFRLPSVTSSSNVFAYLDVPTFSFFPLSGQSAVDDAILDLVEKVTSIDDTLSTNIPNIAQGIINIYNQLKDMGLQLDDIKSVLDIISGLNQSQLEQLEKISSSVDAIYYFLTEALKSESDAVNETTQGAIQDIDSSQQAEDYWQSSMQGNYDSLDLEGFSFGGLAGPLTLVGTIFSDMWTAFGSYSIIFTFPLILGIALLVIGRIGKSGGGGSSRKGGKGGTDDA